MFTPCNKTPSTNSRVFCTSPVTRLKIELEPWTSKKLKLSRCKFGVDLRAQSRHNFALRQPRRDHVVSVGEQGARKTACTTMVTAAMRRQSASPAMSAGGFQPRRIDGWRQRRIQRLPDDVNHQPQQFEPRDAQQQQQEAQHDGPHAIRAKLPGQRQQPSDQFSRGIRFVRRDFPGWLGRLQELKNASASICNRTKNDGNKPAARCRPARICPNQFARENKKGTAQSRPRVRGIPQISSAAAACLRLHLRADGCRAHV